MFRSALLGFIRILMFATFIAATAAPLSVLAWGSEGHRVSGTIAADLLTPKARIRMSQILPGADLADVALYMDVNRREITEQIPGSDKWHYDNQPVCKTKTYKEYCPNNNCASAQIPVYFKILSDVKATQEARVQALRFLVHMVGDIHQPLHAADDDDLGGNLKFVLVPGNDMSRRLHGVWDTDLVKLAIRGQSEADYSKALIARYREKEIPMWQKGEVGDWMNESYGLSKNVTYAKLPHFECGKDWPSSLTSPVALPQPYVNAGVDVIGAQLAKAGARIAWMINQALDTGVIGGPANTANTASP